MERDLSLDMIYFFCVKQTDSLVMHNEEFVGSYDCLKAVVRRNFAAALKFSSC